MYLRGLRAQGLDIEFSVGFTMTKQVQNAIDALPKTPGLRRSRPMAARAMAPKSLRSPAC